MMAAVPTEIEARAFRAYWEDGLLDLLCGFALLAVGAGWWWHYAVVSAVVPALLVPLWAPLRRVLVLPRAGFVEFSRTRQVKTLRGLTTIFILCLAVFLLGVGTFLYLKANRSTGSMPGLSSAIAGLPAALLGIGALVVARLTEARRFDGYGLLLLLLAGVTIGFQSGPAMPMLAGGAVVALSGSVRMTRFVRAAAVFEEGGEDVD